jgi:hypothetical protein
MQNAPLYGVVSFDRWYVDDNNLCPTVGRLEMDWSPFLRQAVSLSERYIRQRGAARGASDSLVLEVSE